MAKVLCRMLCSLLWLCRVLLTVRWGSLAKALCMVLYRLLRKLLKPELGTCDSKIAKHVETLVRTFVNVPGDEPWFQNWEPLVTTFGHR